MPQPDRLANNGGFSPKLAATALEGPPATPTPIEAARRARSRGSRAKRQPITLSERLRSPAAAYAVYAGLIAAVFLLGGGSRGDVLSLVVLRPLAVLAVGFAIWNLDRARLATVQAPVLILGCLIAWMALQLVPLPHGIWTSLPGREVVAAHDRLMGAEIARPISLSPSRTRNSLLSLAVPLATLLLVAAAATRPQRLLLPVLAMAGASAVLGLLQILGPDGGSLYLYRITNEGTPVGLFANRNHHAIFLASLIPLLAYLGLHAGQRSERRALVAAACAGSVLFLVPFVIVTGSRTGTLLMGVALVAAAVLWLAHQPPSSARTTARARRGRFLAALALALAVPGMIAATYLASRSVAFERLFAENFDADLRLRALPQLWNMAQLYFPVGSGFGSFELAYKLIEPFELLRTTYLNQAHNDALQVVIEGGLPALLIVAAFLAWFVASGWRALRRLRACKRDVAVAPFAWASLAILLGGSIGDYPLRTPSIMAFAALLCCLVAGPRQGRARA